MQYLTRKQYARWKKISRQAVHNGISKGRIPVVKRRVERVEQLIPVEDIELQGVKLESLTA